MDGVVQVHRNPTHWYNNASFALPFLATVVVVAAGAIFRRGDILAFAGFLAAVTLCMIPVVVISWRHTPTAVLLTEDGITSLHAGRELKMVPWSAVQAVTRRETQGNVRWMVTTQTGERLALEGELEDLPGLVEACRRLAGLSGG
jgi:hypothetical protein